MSRKRRPSRSKSALPKGAFKLPTGEIVVDRSFTTPNGRRIYVRGVQRPDPELHKLARALIAVAKQTLKRNRD